MKKEPIIQKLINWAQQTAAVRAIVLTSSMASTAQADVDVFSDFDAVVYTNSSAFFASDEWLSFFGTVLVRWPQKPQSTFDKNWITRLIIFESRLRIDFQITENSEIIPNDVDGGYEVLVDKDGITKKFPTPTHSDYLIKKPSEEQFLTCLNDYFWDATYVAKYLRTGG